MWTNAKQSIMGYTSKERKQFNKQRKENGLCIECNNKATHNTLRCDDCRERRKKYIYKDRLKWKEKDLCCQCGKETLNNKNYCKKHYLMKISYARLGTSKYWKELKELIENQNFKCALTGDAISFEDNIELDHILPSYRGGSDELSNVQWVTKQANWFKRALTENELIELCEKIITTLKK